MVQILPENPSFAASFARNFGGGLSRGIASGTDLASQMMLQGQKSKQDMTNKIELEKQKNKQRLDLIHDIENKSKPPQNSMSSELENIFPEIEEKLGFQLTPEQKQSIAEKLQSGGQPQGMQQEEDPFRKAKMYAAAGEHDLANIASKEAETKLTQRKSQQEYDQKKFEADRAFHSKRSDAILEENESFKKILPEQEANLRLIKNAAPDITTKDYIADVLGFEPFRSAKGAQLKSAVKDFLIKTVQSIGGRPNQWIEQQIESALANAGKSKFANLAFGEIESFKLDIRKKRSELIDKLSDEDREKYGYVREDIDKRASKELTSYVREREDKMGYNLRKIYEAEDPERIKDLSPVGKDVPLTLAKAEYLIEEFGDDAVKVAKKLGYIIPPAHFHEED